EPLLRALAMLASVAVKVMLPEVLTEPPRKVIPVVLARWMRPCCTDIETFSVPVPPSGSVVVTRLARENWKAAFSLVPTLGGPLMAGGWLTAVMLMLIGCVVVPDSGNGEVGVGGLPTKTTPVLPRSLITTLTVSLALGSCADDG